LAVDTVVFVGCNFPNCPRTSIYEASERDYRVVVVTDAVSGLYDRALVELADIGAALMTSDEVMDDVTASSADATSLAVGYGEQVPATGYSS
jgi:nicotinamidase-related amidase